MARRPKDPQTYTCWNLRAQARDSAKATARSAMSTPCACGMFMAKWCVRQVGVIGELRRNRIICGRSRVVVKKDFVAGGGQHGSIRGRHMRVTWPEAIRADQRRSIQHADAASAYSLFIDSDRTLAGECGTTFSDSICPYQMTGPGCVVRVATFAGSGKAPAKSGRQLRAFIRARVGAGSGIRKRTFG